ncbi:MAG: class I SAM-dependent methyltransferase, partial [Rhizobiaceae bacterium]
MTDNQKQADYWSSSAGLKWIQFEEELDTVFEAVNETLVNMAQPQCGERIVDIGCGTGATTRAFAEHLGPDGYISAIDISKPLLSHAKSRSRGVETRTNYSLTDAQADAMTDGPFDVAVSRFGVMFFADPVAAFRNIRKWLRPGGRLAIAGWASVDGNPWFEAPRDGAIAQLGPADPSDPHAPG